MTKILLTRHGHVEGITPERFRGRQLLALTERGGAEARALARRIAGAWKPKQYPHCAVAGSWNDLKGKVPESKNLRGLRH